MTKKDTKAVIAAGVLVVAVIIGINLLSQPPAEQQPDGPAANDPYTDVGHSVPSDTQPISVAPETPVAPQPTDPCGSVGCTEKETSIIWRTFVNDEQGVVFQYPDHLFTKFFRFVGNTAEAHWPPQVSTGSTVITCDPLFNMPMQRAWHSVGTRRYCVTTQTEGAAGSMYTTYNYMANIGTTGRFVIFTFVVRTATTCENYAGQDIVNCKREASTFAADLDRIVDYMMQSVRFK